MSPRARRSDDGDTTTTQRGIQGEVAVAALRGDRTLSELASAFDGHGVQIAQWKKRALAALPEAFAAGGKASDGDQEAIQAALYEEIGRLKVELDWLKRK